MPTTYKILSNILLSRLTPYAEEMIGVINVDSDAISQLTNKQTNSVALVREQIIGQLLIIYSLIVK